MFYMKQKREHTFDLFTLRAFPVLGLKMQVCSESEIRKGYGVALLGSMNVLSTFHSILCV